MERCRLKTQSLAIRLEERREFERKNYVLKLAGEIQFENPISLNHWIHTPRKLTRGQLVQVEYVFHFQVKCGCRRMNRVRIYGKCRYSVIYFPEEDPLFSQ